jgi:hypothetical protein
MSQVKEMVFTSLLMVKINFLKFGISERCQPSMSLIDIFNLLEELMVLITEVIDIQILENKQNIHKINHFSPLWVMEFLVL